MIKNREAARGKPVVANVKATATSGPTQTELEIAAGREAIERHKFRRAGPRRTMINKDLGVLVAEELPCDPAVKLPADVRATIARGEAAFRNQGPYNLPGSPNRADRTNPRVITSVVDQKVQERRDANLDARELPPKRARRQPPMVPRLRAAMIVVDRLVADGVPFAVGPNSQMNKAVQKWLNDRASRSPDPRVSRRKQITPTAVRELLKQVRAEGEAVARKLAQRRRSTQEEARERLRELQSRRAASAD
jgi:hypothetical protein